MYKAYVPTVGEAEGEAVGGFVEHVHPAQSQPYESSDTVHVSPLASNQ